MGLPVQEPAGTVRLRKVVPAGTSSTLFVAEQGRQSPLASVSLHVMNEIALPWTQAPSWLNLQQCVAACTLFLFPEVSFRFQRLGNRFVSQVSGMPWCTCNRVSMCMNGGTFQPVCRYRYIQSCKICAAARGPAEGLFRVIPTLWTGPRSRGQLPLWHHEQTRSGACEQFWQAHGCTP